MTDPVSEMDLHAYVDDQLDTGDRFAVETHLSGHPELAAQVMGELSTRTGLQLLSTSAAPLPAALAAQAADLAAPPARSIWRRSLPFAGGAMAATAAGLMLVPEGPPAYVDMALASHRVAMMRAHMVSQVEAPVLDYQEILASTQIHLPALPAHWQITDVQVFPTNGEPALMVAVRTDSGQTLSLFALRERSGAPAIPDAVREGSQSVAYWQRGDMSYALTGEDDPVQLDQTAEGLNRSWS